jgi:hypothetical protein
LFTVFGYAKGIILETETGHQEQWLLSTVSFENFGNSLQLQKQSTDGVAILKITDAICSGHSEIRKENNHINWYENCLLLVSMHLVLALVIFCLNRTDL